MSSVLHARQTPTSSFLPCSILTSNDHQLQTLDSSTHAEASNNDGSLNPPTLPSVPISISESALPLPSSLPFLLPPAMSSDPTHLAHVAFNQTFLLSSAYTEIRPLGIGAYGDVVKAKRLNEESGADEWVAVKRVKGIGGKR